MKHTDRRQIQTIFALSTKKSPATEPAPSGRQRENCQNVTEYRIFCARMAFCCPGAFSYLWGWNIGPSWPEPCPRCRSPPRFALTHWPERNERSLSMSGKKITYNPPATKPKRPIAERVVSERGRKKLPPGTKGGGQIII